MNVEIRPEIAADELAALLTSLAAEADGPILDIGASSGEGSTAALLAGARQNPHRPVIYALEPVEARFQALQANYQGEAQVQCLQAASLPPNSFATEDEIAAWCERHPDAPVSEAQLLNWRAEGLAWLWQSGVTCNGIAWARKAAGQPFALVVLDGCELTGDADLRAVYGSRVLVLDDTRTLKNADNYRRLCQDPNYTRIAENPALRNGYAVFRLIDDPLPLHVLTIVLNGLPYLPDILETLKNLPCRWQWHVVEGAAAQVEDTGWSLPNGSRLPDEWHRAGLSVDGTSEWLDAAQAEHSQVRVYRTEGGLWPGKRAMVSAPLAAIGEECLLLQVDADEEWTAAQIARLREMFLAEPERTAAWFWCRFFVGPDRVVSTRGGYSQKPEQEWLRAWRYRPGMWWHTHEPPQLLERVNATQARSVGLAKPFTHEETEQAGLVFNHYAYASEEQVAFKEAYYGYRGAVEAWRRLQDAPLPCRLGDFFPWVQDETLVGPAAGATSPVEPAPSRSPRVVVDGVFWQSYRTGIARVWQEILSVWAGQGKDVVLLDRAGTAPEIPGVERRLFQAHDYEDPQKERGLLQDACYRALADVFLSTYYSHPEPPHATNLHTPSVQVVYDMIPEVMGWDLKHPMWAEKTAALRHAARFVCISHNTERDLVKFYPRVEGRTRVAHCGLSAAFYPPTQGEVAAVKAAVGRPFFLLSAPGGYKNPEVLLRALVGMPERREVAVLSTRFPLAPEVQALCPDVVCAAAEFTDAELRAVYGAAEALVFPSRYEGFGMPVLEAMACGCPVITSPLSSLPEVGGDAVLYVDPDNVPAMQRALREVRQPEVRARLTGAGLQRASRFRWEDMAAAVWAAVEEAAKEQA